MAKEEALSSPSEERAAADIRPARPRRDAAPESPPAPPQQPAAKHYVVAPDKTVSTLRGRVLAGKHVTAADFAGGADAFKEIVRAGFVVEGAAPRVRKAARST